MGHSTSDRRAMKANLDRLLVFSMYAAALALAIIAQSPAAAGEAPQGKPVTIRGKITALEGQTLKVATKEGEVEQVAVEKVQGPMLTLKYKDGEQKVFVPPGTPIVRNVSADRSALKPGAGVYVAAVRGAD